MVNLPEQFIRVSDEKFKRRQAARNALNEQERQLLDARLLHAVGNNQDDELYEVLQQGAHPDATQNGFSGLMRASDKDFFVCAHILLAARAKPFLEAPAVLRLGQIVSKSSKAYTPEYGDIPVIAPLLAIRKGYLSTLKAYCTQGVSVPENRRAYFVSMVQQLESSIPANVRRSVRYYTNKLLAAPAPC